MQKSRKLHGELRAPYSLAVQALRIFAKEVLNINEGFSIVSDDDQHRVVATIKKLLVSGTVTVALRPANDTQHITLYDIDIAAGGIIVNMKVDTLGLILERIAERIASASSDAVECRIVDIVPPELKHKATRTFRVDLPPPLVLLIARDHLQDAFAYALSLGNGILSVDTHQCMTEMSFRSGHFVRVVIHPVGSVRPSMSSDVSVTCAAKSSLIPESYVKHRVACLQWRCSDELFQAHPEYDVASSATPRRQLGWEMAEMAIRETGSPAGKSVLYNLMGGGNVYRCGVFLRSESGIETELGSFEKLSAYPLDLLDGADRTTAEGLIQTITAHLRADAWEECGRGPVWHQRRFRRAIYGEPSSQNVLASGPKDAGDVEVALEKLTTLREKGLVTEEEYAEKRKDILGRL